MTAREYLDAVDAQYDPNGMSHDVHILGLVAALRAVLDLHTDEHGECFTCSDEWGPKPWPCQTVRAIEAKLGGES